MPLVDQVPDPILIGHYAAGPRSVSSLLLGVSMRCFSKGSWARRAATTPSGAAGAPRCRCPWLSSMALVRVTHSVEQAKIINRHPEPLGGALQRRRHAVGMLMPRCSLFRIAFPLVLQAATYDRSPAHGPLTRLVLFSLVALSLFHWAHRFRHTLYDGLQIKHLNAVVAVVSYGSAVVGSGLAAYLLWQIG